MNLKFRHAQYSRETVGVIELFQFFPSTRATRSILGSFREIISSRRVLMVLPGEIVSKRGAIINSSREMINPRRKNIIPRRKNNIHQKCLEMGGSRVVGVRAPYENVG